MEIKTLAKFGAWISGLSIFLGILPNMLYVTFFPAEPLGLSEIIIAWVIAVLIIYVLYMTITYPLKTLGWPRGNKKEK